MKEALGEARTQERPVGGDEHAAGQPGPRAPGRMVLGEIPWLLLLAVVGALVALLGAPVIVRTLLGLPLILFIPGYALTSALFPSREGLDDIERLALGFGLSLALIPLVALGIEYSPWRLTLVPILAGLLAVTVFFSGVAILRRARLPAHRRYVPGKPRLSMPHPRDWSRRSRFAVAIFALGLLLLTGAGGIIVAERLQGEPMTEFALYNAEGKPEFYPRQLGSGQPATVLIEVTNREGKAESYHLKVTAAGSEVSHADAIRVEDGATVQQPVTIHDLPTTQGQIPIDFNLYRDDQPAASSPYRTLRLYVTTGSQPAPPS